MDFIKQIVSGPQNRFKEEGYNLDLTYITPRVVAMAFPASGAQTLYRNSISQVVKLISDKHGDDYYVFNLSGRVYNTEKFGHRVSSFEWEDHHSPPIDTLFQVCNQIHKFLLSQPENIVLVHCLAGQGRTGTIICCYMLYSGLFQHPSDALAYYAKKRFHKDGKGVTQPCQIRYIYYFYHILTKQNIYPTYKKLKHIVFNGRPHFNKDDGCRPYFQLFYVRSKTKIVSTKKSHSQQTNFDEGISFSENFTQPIPLHDDVLLKIYNNWILGNQDMARISFSTAFIEESNELIYNIHQLSPDTVKKNSRFPLGFQIKLIFQQINSSCTCTNTTPFETQCQICHEALLSEKSHWDKIYEIVGKYEKPQEKVTLYLLFGEQFTDDRKEILSHYKEDPIQLLEFNPTQEVLFQYSRRKFSLKGQQRTPKVINISNNINDSQDGESFHKMPEQESQIFNQNQQNQNQLKESEIISINDSNESTSFPSQNTQSNIEDESKKQENDQQKDLKVMIEETEVQTELKQQFLSLSADGDEQNSNL